MEVMGDYGTVKSSSAKMEKRLLEGEEIEEWLGLTIIEGR